jgi:hypothetical protein
MEVLVTYFYLAMKKWRPSKDVMRAREAQQGNVLRRGMCLDNYLKKDQSLYLFLQAHIGIMSIKKWYFMMDDTLKT